MWSGRRFGFAIHHLLSGIKNALAADIIVGRKCLVFFEFDTEDIVKIENTYTRVVLLDDNSVSDEAVIVPLVFFVGLCLAVIIPFPLGLSIDELLIFSPLTCARFLCSIALPSASESDGAV